LEEEVKTLFHTKNNGIKKEINKLEIANSQLENEVTYLQTPTDELHEKDAPIQLENMMPLDLGENQDT